MTRKLTIATVAFFCLLGGLAYAAGSADAKTRDGQKCPIVKPVGAPWRMAPDSCRYVAPYGGFIQLGKACTELDVVRDGKLLPQHLWRGRSVWGNYIASPTGERQYTIDSSGGTLVNGGYRTVRVYCWYS